MYDLPWSSLGDEVLAQQYAVTHSQLKKSSSLGEKLSKVAQIVTNRP